MPANHLVRERVDHVGDGKLAAFGGQLRVEDDLEEQVAELLAQLRVVAAFDRVDDFVGLLDQIAHERLRGSVRGPTDTNAAGAP